MKRVIDEQVEEYLADCKKRNLSPKTIINYRDEVARLLKDVEADRIQKVTNEMIEEHLKMHDWSPCYINHHIISLKTMFRWFDARGYKLKFKPELLKRTIEPEKNLLYFTKEQIDKVLDECDTMDWIMIRLCFECGLRISELDNLKPEDIEGNRIKFIGKGRKCREVYVSDDLRQAIESWIAYHQGWDYLWMQEINGRRRLYTVNGLRKRMQKAFNRAGFDEFHPHALRHSFATHVVNNGAPLHIVRDMMGHTRVSTTMRYIHRLDGQLQKAFSEYGAY